MNMLVKSVVTITAMVLVSYTTMADVPSSQPNIPAGQWESHAEGVALALTLTTRTEKGVQKSFVTVYLKNTSNTVKKYINDGVDSGFDFYTLDGSGSWHPLRDHNPGGESNFAVPQSINPGETISRTIDLSADDLALIKARSIKCKFFFFNPGTHQKGFVESSPRQLTEIVETPPNK